MIRQLLQYKFTLIISALILAICVAYVFRSESVFSESENRYLAGRPGMTLSGLADGSFMEAFELYVKEQLPARDGLIRLKALAEQAQLKNENNGIIRGRDGYLFEKLIRTNSQLDRNEAAIVRFVKDTDREVNICIIPNSFEIMTDKLPKAFPNISEEERISDLYDKLSGMKNVHTINMYDGLKAHKDEYIYYRTDHHWTTFGAYYGYLRLCDEMGLEPVDIGSLESIKKEADGFFGTFYSKYRGAGIKPDILTYYDIAVKGYRAGAQVHDSIYDTAKLDTYDKYAMFMYGNEGLSLVDSADDITDAAGNKGGIYGKTPRRKELVVFKDSYANCLIPYLTYDYDRLIVVDLRYYPDPVSGLLKEHPDADILLIYNFMHYNEDNHFYRLTS